MRCIKLEVPVQVISEFVEKLLELELECSIVGKTDDDEIEIEVPFGKSEIKEVDELEDYLSELIEEIEDSEE